MTDKQKAIIRYGESHIEKEEQSPLERLRYFCSLAMDGEDWVDAGHFFDSLALQVRDKVDVGPWSAGTTSDGRAFLESSDFTHDVRLYVDGDFAWPDDKLNYAQGIAQQLNTAPVSAEPTLPYEQALSELIDKAVPGLDTGDLLADAKQASAALDISAPVATQPSGNAGELPAIERLPRLTEPEAPANTAGLPFHAHTNVQMLSYGRTCAEAQRKADQAALAQQDADRTCRLVAEEYNRWIHAHAASKDFDEFLADEAARKEQT